VSLLERARPLRKLDLDDLVPFCPEVVEVPLLMEVALVSDELRESLAALRPIAAWTGVSSPFRWVGCDRRLVPTEKVSP
jgi:hypothetical protein